MDEITKEQAVEGLEKSIRAMIQIQWDLADYGTLGADIQEPLTSIGEYFMTLLQVIDSGAAHALHDELSRNTLNRPGKSPVQDS